jgi:hypothetical protein
MNVQIRKIREKKKAGIQNGTYMISPEILSSAGYKTP